MGVDLIDPPPEPDTPRGAQPAEQVETSETVRTGRGRTAAVGIAVVALAAVAVWLASPQSDPVLDERATPTTALVPTGPSPSLVDTDTENEDEIGPTGVIEFQPAVTPDPPRVTVAAGDDELALWSVDLAAGITEEIPVPPLPGETTPPVLTDVRFFGPERAVAVDSDDRYHVLAIDGTTVEREAVVDLGTRNNFGIAALTPDGTQAWVGIPTGLIRWRLADDEVDQRWIDSFGDRTRLPQVRVVNNQGLVVEGSGRNFLVAGGEAEALDVDGEVVAAAGDWVVTRSCDDLMRCGQLMLHDLATEASLALNREYRFRLRCGLAAPGTNAGTAHVIAERLGVLVLLTIGPGETITERDLHPSGIGCVDAAAVDGDRLVIAHEPVISLVTGDDFEVVYPGPVGRIVAVGADAR